MMRKIIAALTLCACLAGCGESQLQPPPLLTVPQIQAQMALTSAIAPAQVHDFMVNGFTLAQMNCGGFFDSAVMNSLQNAQSVGQANILSGLALGLLGLSGVGGPAVSAVGLGTTAIVGALNNQQQNSLAGTDPAGMYTLTAAAQQTVIGALPTPVSGADAYAAVYAVERACTPAGIQALKEAAINAAPSHLVVTPGPAPAISGARVISRPWAPGTLPTVTVH